MFKKKVQYIKRIKLVVVRKMKHSPGPGLYPVNVSTVLFKLNKNSNVDDSENIHVKKRKPWTFFYTNINSIETVNQMNYF